MANLRLTANLVGNHNVASEAIRPRPIVGWLEVALLGGMLIAANFPMLRVTAVLLEGDQDLAHGLFAPFVALYIAWCNRHVLRSTALKQDPVGLVALILGCVIGVISSLGSSASIGRVGFLVSLVGVILLWGGWPLVKALRFPLFLLLFTFPIPTVLYSEITQPLQLLASIMSERVLDLLGYGVLREGNILHLSNQAVSVAEACSGLRSLMSLSFFCVVYAYFLEERAYLRILVFLAAVPAALVLNVGRITFTCIVGKSHPEWTHGVYHDIVGWICFALGALLVLAAHQLALLAIAKAERRGAPECAR